MQTDLARVYTARIRVMPLVTDLIKLDEIVLSRAKGAQIQETSPRARATEPAGVQQARSGTNPENVGARKGRGQSDDGERWW